MKFNLKSLALLISIISSVKGNNINTSSNLINTNSNVIIDDITNNNTNQKCINITDLDT